MFLGARLLKDVSSVNRFTYGDSVCLTEGSAATIYLQLADFSVDTDLRPSGRRYVPSSGATLSVTLRSIDTGATIVKSAVQPFADDLSIWMFELDEDETLPGTHALKLVLTETLPSDTGAVRASGTATLSGVVATETLVIAGVSFTAVASDPGANEFAVDASDDVTADNLADAINTSQSTAVKGVVAAFSAGPVVSVRAVTRGTGGNAITFTETGAGITVSGAGTLTGGVAGPEAPKVTMGWVEQAISIQPMAPEF